MRLEAINRQVESTGIMQTAKATIKATPKIFSFFQDMTYANKPVAILRELVANGVDAQVAAGNPNRPVEVTLPNELEPTCKVRDYGTGMAHDFVMGPFMAYTDGSTKDTDNKAIGGFGIGSKSPFAYVDQYTLRVVHDGVVSLYSMFKDEDGIPAIGLIGQGTTDEHNGVEVSFPVESKDIQTFHEAAQTALQYFRPLPLIINGDIKAPDYTYVGTNWALRPEAGELGVIMGGVRYPVLQQNLDYTLLRGNSKLEPLLSYGIDLTMPIGSVGVALSREQLSYTPETSKAIANALNSVVNDVISTFSTMFDNAPSEWDAMKMLAKETGGASYYQTGRQKMLSANARYKGQPLRTVFELTRAQFGKLAKVWTIEAYNSRRHRTSMKSAKWDDLGEFRNMYPGNYQEIIIDDLPDSPKSKVGQKVRAHLEGVNMLNAVLVLRPYAGVKIADILSELRNPTDVTYTSSMPEPAVVPKVKSNRHRVRMFRFNGKTDKWTHSTIVNLTPARSKADAVKEVKYADQPASGTMVVMKSFDLPKKFAQMMALGWWKYDDLVFVNEVDAVKIASTFVNFEVEFNKKLAAELAKYPDLAERIAVSDNTELYDFFNLIRKNPGRFGTLLTKAERARPFGRISTLFDKYVKPLTDEQRKYAPFIDLKLPKGLNPAKLVKEFEAAQPKFALLMSAQGNYNFRNQSALLVDMMTDYL